MKNALLIIALLFAVPAFAQETDGVYATEAPIRTRRTEYEQPFRDANAIVIHNSEAPAAFCEKLKDVLTKEGYTTKQDGDNITTSYRAVPSNKAMYTSLSFAVVPEGSGCKVKMKGIYTLPKSYTKTPHDGKPIECRGAMGSPLGQAWADFVRVGRLCGEQIGYAKITQLQEDIARRREKKG